MESLKGEQVRGTISACLLHAACQEEEQSKADAG